MNAIARQIEPSQSALRKAALAAFRDLCGALSRAAVIVDPSLKICEVGARTPRYLGLPDLAPGQELLLVVDGDPEPFRCFVQQAATSTVPVPGRLSLKTARGVVAHAVFGSRFDPLRVGDSLVLLRFADVSELVGGFRLLNEELQRERALVHELRRRQSEVEQAARLDVLTAVPGRMALETDIRDPLGNRRRRDHADTIVVFIDLDGLKTVNDTCGHEVGDELLQAFALRLKQNLREEDTLYRYGGDEFVLALRGMDDADAVIGAKIGGVVESLHEAGFPAGVGASWGLCRVGEAGSFEKALRRADSRMYAMKRERKTADRTQGRTG